MAKNIVRFTEEDAAAVLGRPLTDNEYQRLVKTAEFLFPEIFAEMVENMEIDNV